MLGRWIGLLRMSPHRVLHVRRSLTNTPPKYYPIYCYMLHAIKTLFCVLSIRTLGGGAASKMQLTGSIVSLQYLATVDVYCALAIMSTDCWDVLILDVFDRSGGILLISPKSIRSLHSSSSLSLLLRVLQRFYDNVSTKYLSTDCYTPHAIESSCVQLIVASTIWTMWILCWIFDLMRAGSDLVYSNCKRLDGLLNGYNIGARFGFLRLPKLHWMELITA
jgi:hypothetical protein